jgi:hypothetical protein
MHFLRVIPASCSLDTERLQAQLARYRAAGDGARIIERRTDLVSIRVGPEVTDAALEELVTVERSCCPFFELDWRPRERSLTVAVARPDDEPALRAIVYALGLESTDTASGTT